MKMKLVTSIDDVSKVPVYIGTKNKGWAYFLDVMTQQPMFVYVGTRHYELKEELIAFIDEIRTKVTDKQHWFEIAERLRSKDDFEIFDYENDGQASYYKGLMLVCLRPDVNLWTIVHECVHLSQFLLIFKYGDGSVVNNTAKELQADIAETYTAIVQKIHSTLKKGNK